MVLLSWTVVSITVRFDITNFLSHLLKNINFCLLKLIFLEIRLQHCTLNDHLKNRILYYKYKHLLKIIYIGASRIVNAWLL